MNLYLYARMNGLFINLFVSIFPHFLLLNLCFIEKEFVVKLSDGNRNFWLRKLKNEVYHPLLG